MQGCNLLLVCPLILTVSGSAWIWMAFKKLHSKLVSQREANPRYPPVMLAAVASIRFGHPSAQL